MTNSPFDDQERPVWDTNFQRDNRFAAGLRIDPLLLAWPSTAPKLASWGYDVTSERKRPDEMRRFLANWTRRIDAKYLMVSLPPDFSYPAENEANQLLEHAVLPHCREFGLPLAVMPGVRRSVNPQLQLAGDGVGCSDLRFLQHLCSLHPENKFMATVLAKENQHELCVLARKFRNLHIFGCWWFTNTPSIMSEVTAMRVELLGLSFTAQHSDARVLDQIIYKWRHSREVVSRVLIQAYTDLAVAGWEASPQEVKRDVGDLFGGSFQRFLTS
jgi:hypothetical protein